MPLLFQGIASSSISVLWQEWSEDILRYYSAQTQGQIPISSITRVIILGGNTLKRENGRSKAHLSSHTASSENREKRMLHRGSARSEMRGQSSSI